MAKKNNDRFELNKGGGRKFDLDKGTGKRKFDLSKDVDDELIDNEETTAPATSEETAPAVPTPPVTPVNPPQPEEPTSVQQPDLSEEKMREAIEYGPEEPKKKGTAWIWAIIGIAIVLAFIGWTLLRKGNSEGQTAAEPTAEEVVSDSANEATDTANSLPLTEATEAPATDENGAATSDNGTATNTESAEPAGSTTATSPSTPAASAPTANSASSSAASAPTAKSASSSTASTPTAKSASSSVASAPEATNLGEVESEALKVIHGDYGDGNERRQRLGSRYAEIQRRVNQLKRDGKF